MKTARDALSLRPSAPAVAYGCAAALLVVYGLTMARGLTFYDSPELALVAHQLGVGHPAGQPLHTLVGALFARLPGCTPALGLTLMSALFAALAALPAWSIADSLGGPTRSSFEAAIRAGVTLAVGASFVAWQSASRVEVYSLASLLALWSIARALRSERASHALVVGVGLGLAGSAHLVLGAAAAVAVAPALLERAWRGPGGPAPSRADAAIPEGEATQAEAPEEGDDDPRPDALRSRPDPALTPTRGAARRVGRWALGVITGGLLGLLPYAHVPLASGDPRRFAWGDADTLEGFAAYLRGADYRHNQTITFEGFSAHLADLASWGLDNGSLLVAVAGFAAFLSVARGADRLVAPLAGALAVAFVAANVVFHPDVPDYCGYYLPGLWLAAAGLMAGARAAAAKVAAASAQRWVRPRVASAAVAFVPVVGLALSPGHLAGPRDSPPLAEVMAEGALAEAPPGAILLVASDHWVAPLLYRQEVDGLRPDVVVLAQGLGSSEWYWEHVFARHPDLEPVALRGPGGLAGRLQRLRAANPTRPVAAESVELLAALGARACGVGFLVHGGERCAVAPGAATEAVERAAPLRGEALEVAARLGEARGVALWRLGRGAHAVHALLAGLGSGGWDRGGLASPDALDQTLTAIQRLDFAERAPPLSGALPSWSRPAALHDPARNLALAALLLAATGAREPAARLADAAAEIGLPGAAEVQARVRR